MHLSSDTLHIAVAESSVIIRNGITATLERVPSLMVHIVEVTSMEGLHSCMEVHSPDVLIVNPMFCGKFSLEKMRSVYPLVKYVALATSYLDASLMAEYDAVLSVFDDIDSIGRMFGKVLHSEGVCELPEKVYEVTDTQEAMPQNVLSQREKEIVVCVVKGLTNKEIADKLYLSVHTVITHRRNISRKLQIHSAAGLTIYAIANKLIELKELEAV